MFYSKELSREQNIKHSTERCSGAANDAPNVLFSTNSCVSVYNRLLTLITGCQFGPDSLALDVTCVFNQTEIFCIFVQSHNISVYTVSIWWLVQRWHITNCFIAFILKWEFIIIKASSLFQPNTTDLIRVLMGMIRKRTETRTYGSQQLQYITIWLCCYFYQSHSLSYLKREEKKFSKNLKNFKTLNLPKALENKVCEGLTYYNG